MKRVKWIRLPSKSIAIKLAEQSLALSVFIVMAYLQVGFCAGRYDKFYEHASRNPFMPGSFVGSKKKSSLNLISTKKSLKTQLVQLNYAKVSDVAVFIHDNHGLLSKRGKVSVDVRTNRLWIQDTHDNRLTIGPWYQRGADAYFFVAFHNVKTSVLRNF